MLKFNSLSYKAINPVKVAPRFGDVEPSPMRTAVSSVMKANQVAENDPEKAGVLKALAGMIVRSELLKGLWK